MSDAQLLILLATIFWAAAINGEVSPAGVTSLAMSFGCLIAALVVWVAA